MPSGLDAFIEAALPPAHDQSDSGSRNSEGNTALDYARRRGHVAVAELLANRGR